jgi:hypothetical protein
MDNRSTYGHAYGNKRPLKSRVSSRKARCVTTGDARTLRAFCVSGVVLHTLARGDIPACVEQNGRAYTNKPAQQALFERLCKNTADRKRTISPRMGAVEEESNGYTRGSAGLYVSSWPKAREFPCLACSIV